MIKIRKKKKKRKSKIFFLDKTKQTFLASAQSTKVFGCFRDNIRKQFEDDTASWSSANVDIYTQWETNKKFKKQKKTLQKKIPKIENSSNNKRKTKFKTNELKILKNENKLFEKLPKKTCGFDLLMNWEERENQN